MRNAHCRTWNMARKTEKGGKFRNFHCRTWMEYGKKTENHKKLETSTLRLENCRNH